MSHPIEGLMGTTLEKIREMVDASTVVGEPVIAGGNTIIPVSKISYGFASGGSDFPSKSQTELFGGGGGAGVTVAPVAFIVITAQGAVKLLPVSAKPDTADKIVNMVPDIVDKVSDLISNRGKKQPEAQDDALLISEE